MIEIVTVMTIIATIINFFTAVAIVFFEKRNPKTTIVWLFVFALLPIPGLIFYIFLGRGVRIKTRKLLNIKVAHDIEYDRSINNYRSNLALKRELIVNNNVSFNDRKTETYYDLIKMNYLMGNSQYTQDNSVQIFTDGKSKFDALLNDINNAKNTINLLYFIIRDDTLGRKLLKVLTEKASQGVEVRFCYDHLGSILTSTKIYKDLIKAGGKVHPFFPLRFGTLQRLNYRNHRKLVIIDGQIGYIGGMNIGTEYLGEHKRITPWGDIHMRIEGSAVHYLQSRFLKDWFYATSEDEIIKNKFLKKFFPEIPSSGKTGIQIVSSGPDVKGEQIKRAIIKMINAAKKTIYIQTPYFIPDESFLEALQTASVSGVEVSIMIPQIPDKRYVYYATTSYIKELQEYGINFYLYRGFMHSKMVVVDDEIATIGTTNMDIRSFSLHFEVNAFIYDSEVAYECAQIFLADTTKSIFVEPDFEHKNNIMRVFFEGICRLFAPLM